MFYWQLTGSSCVPLAEERRSWPSGPSDRLQDYSRWELEKRLAEIVGELPQAAQQVLAWEDPAWLLLQIHLVMATLLENSSARPRTTQFIKAWSNADYEDRLAALLAYRKLASRRESLPLTLPRKKRRARQLAYTRNWKFTMFDGGCDALQS